MASISERKDKNGEIVSYRIRVSRGRGLKPYEMSWPERGESIPATWSKKTVEKEVQKVAAEFEMRCKRGEVSIEKLTFSEYAERVLKTKEFEGTKFRTLERYHSLLVRINDPSFGIGHLYISEIRPDQLNAFYQKLAEPGMRCGGGTLSPKTRLEYSRLIHNVLGQAVREGLICSNTADRATKPKVPHKEAESLEIEEVKAIFAALESEDIKWRALIHLLAASGGRRGEICGLRWENVDFSKNTIYVCSTVLYSPKKGIYESTTKTGENRTVSISPEDMKILREWKIEQTAQRLRIGELWQERGFVFTQANGSPMCPDSVTDFCAKFSERHGLKHLHPHMLRHAQASMLLSAGTDIVTVSKRLGHAKVDTTLNIYSHVLEKADSAAANTFSALIHKKNA